jgi:adenylate cyclase
VVVTVQKAVEDAPGHLAGVLRVGLLARTIDELSRVDDAEGPQRVTLSDSEGRLIARVDPSDRIVIQDDDLRVVSTSAPLQVITALKPPLRSRSFDVDGVRYLATFRKLDDTQSCVAGIIVPEAYYTHDLLSLRDRFLFAFFVLTAVVLLAGTYVLRQLKRSLGRIVDATSQMRRFDFTPSRVDAPLEDIAQVMEGVERAKTSMRALGKYVPIDLVRQLYESNREPELGGDLVEISMMFTDIEGFTTLAERLAPDALAKALGAYLEAMTRAVTSTGGTVDKFIGDAVMAFWNAPTPRPDHARRACRAVLACMGATRELYSSEAWADLPPLFTRFGLNTARVMVGHFGAPQRLAYTALGDGVNLAARLEPLCKHYGVAVLAGEAIVEQAGDDLMFRLVDQVAVKGKSRGLRVYELLGARGECVDASVTVRAYERALDIYWAGNFAQARDLFATIENDPPSRVMLARCEAMLLHAPPEDWNGVYVATSK